MQEALQEFQDTSGNISPRPFGETRIHISYLRVQKHTKKTFANAIVKFYDTGHFALETHTKEIGNDILDFMETLTR